MRPLTMASGLITLMVVVSNASALEAPFIDGDLQSWQNVTNAYTKLIELKSYRAKSLRVPGLVVEVVNPDRYHYALRNRNVTFEQVTVAGESRFRVSVGDPSGPWKCTATHRFGEEFIWKEMGALLPRLPQLIREASKFESVKISRLDELMIEGQGTQGYQYTIVVDASTPPIREKVFVLQAGGLPRRVQQLDLGERVTRAVDYYDYSTQIDVTLPRCENT